MPAPAAFFAMLIFGSIGLGAFIYGKKVLVLRPIVLGLVLMIYPYFVSGAMLLWGIGTLLTVGLFYPKS
jgi:hypothetical protein